MFEGEGTADQTLAAVDYNDDIELALQMQENIADAEALEPSSLAEARRRPHWLQWEQGIHEELAMLNKAKTWELVKPPRGVNIIGSKWVFCAKKGHSRKRCSIQGMPCRARLFTGTRRRLF